MELINYLNSHYLTKNDLLTLTKTTENELIKFQRQNIMPKCSYELALKYSCNSFFGEHQAQSSIEYYAKGYMSWLGMLKSIKSNGEAYDTFSKRYTQEVNKLKNMGFNSNSEKLNDKLDLHIEEEWQHFLDGIYGLCTKSGLPEDIASKETAILQINDILNEAEPNRDMVQLTRAVNLLDQSSSLFAPHERLRSSRHRLIDEVRRNYKLKRSTLSI